MDILSHTFSGLAIGATAIHFSKGGFRYKSILVLTCGIAAFFPDLDVISQWSGFDSTFGEWFDLSESGKSIYHQKRWYSHHALFHSITMAIVFVLMVLGIMKLIFKKDWKNVVEENKIFLIAVFVSYLAHIFEDMPTPDFVWGGVAFLFPSENYWGGKGYIWWWNNYDLFLIIIGVFFVNLNLKLWSKLLKVNLHKIAGFILLLGVGLYLHQMFTRPYDFNYSGMKGHNEVWRVNETRSKEVQKEILGEDIYNLMEGFDQSISIWF